MKKIKILLILLITIINLMFMSSCWVAGMFTIYKPTELFESGYLTNKYRSPFEGVSSTPFFAIKSDKNIFDINDVTVDLYIALYEKGEVKIYGKKEYHHVDFVCYTYEYIENEEGKQEKNILNEKIVRTLSNEEVLNEDLYVTLYNERVINYKYHEQLTLSEEIFVQNEGYISLTCYLYNSVDENSIERKYRDNYIIFKYIKLDDQTIQISFEYENYEDKDVLEYNY